ncbi:hypothetical protein KFL_000680240 [Klebsormidium nitens]|uniref:Uncharacterized protein n=1 Tax=Klebsormidium nitens TaxID=105231 RepID=A0A0U9HJ49_KLENI|nr:hypothetical protein KFL_000680240 [Klebsormidium nitens]|eukprot:GAQ81007.1 hypothetical protein KFL_000680240 [Klebsormidium nitens]
MAGRLDMEQIVQKLKSERGEEITEALQTLIAYESDSTRLKERRILQELTLIENGRVYVKLLKQMFCCPPDKDAKEEQERLGFTELDGAHLRGSSTRALLHMARSKVVADFLTAHSGAKEMLHNVLLTILEQKIISKMDQGSSSVDLHLVLDVFLGLVSFVRTSREFRSIIISRGEIIQAAKWIFSPGFSAMADPAAEVFFLRETIALFLSMVSRYPETHDWLIDQGIVELASQMYKMQEKTPGESGDRIKRHIPLFFSNIIWQENGRRRLRETGAFSKLSEISALIQKAHRFVPLWMLFEKVLRDGEDSWLGEPVILKMLGKMLKKEIGDAAQEASESSLAYAQGGMPSAGQQPGQIPLDLR